MKVSLVCALLFAVTSTPSFAYKSYLYAGGNGYTAVTRYQFDSENPLAAVPAPAEGQTGAIFADVHSAGVAVDAALGYLYVTSDDSVLRFNLITGAYDSTLIISGLSAPGKVVIGNDGNLYISNQGRNASGGYIARYRKDGTPFPASGRSDALFAPITEVTYPAGFAFGPDGNLYVGNNDNASVYRYSGIDGSAMGQFANSSELFIPNDISFGADGNMYVASIGGPSWGIAFGHVVCFDGTTGAYLSIFADRKGATAAVWGPNNNLFVSGYHAAVDQAIKQYDGATGAYLGDFVLDDGDGQPFGFMEFGVAQVSVSGNVVVKDYSAAPETLGVTVEFLQNGAVIYTKRVFLDAQGNFSLPGAVFPGTYDVAIKAATSLRKILPAVVLEADKNIGSVELTGGDIDGDNEVTSTDLSILGLNLGLMGD